MTPLGQPAPVKLASLVTVRNVLLFSLAAEGVTAVVVILAPGLVAALLFGMEVSGTGVVFGRLLGFTLLALVIACWPGADAPSGTRPGLRAVFVYNLLMALYLAYLGLVEGSMGLLLWPAVAEHALVALLLGARNLP